jgi:hypothetical protein
VARRPQIVGGKFKAAWEQRGRNELGEAEMDMVHFRF